MLDVLHRGAGAASSAPTNRSILFQLLHLRLEPSHGLFLIGGGRNLLLQERDFRGGPIGHAVAGQAEHRGGRMSRLERQVNGQAHGAERVRPQPAEPRFDTRERRLCGQAGALDHVQAVAGKEQRPEMRVFVEG